RIRRHMTAKKPPTSRNLVSQTAGPVDKRRRKRGLTTAVRTAIDAMIYDRCTRAQACKRAGFSERALYLALAKAEVAMYWNQALQVLRVGERASNIHRLCAIHPRREGKNRVGRGAPMASAHPWPGIYWTRKNIWPGNFADCRGGGFQFWACVAAPGPAMPGHAYEHP